MKMLPQQPQTIAMQGADGRGIQLRQLRCDPGIGRRLVVPTLQGVAQAPLQFRRGGFGEGDNQKTIQPHRRLRVQGEMQDPLDQRVGLARARPCHHQHIALGLHGRPLLFRQ